MSDDESTTFYEDITAPQGTDLFWAFELEPFDGTGCTSQFVTDFGTYSVTISVTSSGSDPVTSFSVRVLASVMAALSGVYAWRHLVTFADGTILEYGRGSIVVG